MPADVDLSHPSALLLLAALAALLVLVRLPWWRPAVRQRPAGEAPLRAEVRRFSLRMAWFSLPVLALAGLAISRPMERLAVVLVVDTSASVSSVRDVEDEAVARALAALAEDDVAGVVAVGQGARVEQAVTLNPLLTKVGGLNDTASDLATGLALAGGLVPAGRSGRVVLLSDGRETSGDAVAAAQELRSRGITVDVLPVGPRAEADVRLDRLDLAETARERETAVLRVTVTSGLPTSAQLQVTRDDELIVDQAVELHSGPQELALSLPPAAPGTHRLRVEIAPADQAAESMPLNNALGAVQRVVGAPRVLIVTANAGNAGYLPSAFESGGAMVEVGAPSALPADLAGMAAFDAVVLADVPSYALPAGSMELLERYVRELGRGLVMTGGPDAFGLGGYADTPVEKALPVYMDLQGRGRQPRVAMMLVIDKSGSMSGLKMEMAKEAAARSVRLLNPEDQAGVLAFDSVPQWVSPLVKVGDGSALSNAIGTVYADGGTEIYPAVTTALENLRTAEADVKHIILLTDGVSGSGGDYPAFLQSLREQRITLSSVAVGADADIALLEAMARGGRGRAHVATDPEQLPEIFTQETIMATRSILVDGAFFPASASASPLLRGLDRVPPLQGYVAVTPKERAEVVLLAPEGDPVLAAWQYGAGRALAWTPDLGTRWSADWSASDTGRLLWGNALSWLLPPPEAGELRARVEAAGGGFAIVAENQTSWDDVRPTRVTVVGAPQGPMEIELSPAGPGRYRAPLPALDAGAYVIQVQQALAGGESTRVETGWAAPYPAEYRAVGVDAGKLRQIAEAGRGSVLEDAVLAVRRAEEARVSRWDLAPLLLVLAALLWPLEIASRRFTSITLPPWLRLPWSLRAKELSRSSPSGAPALPSTRRPSAPIPQPQVETANRLLERTRSMRQQRRR